jgi:calcineurin-like phosphoesterase family protein
MIWFISDEHFWHRNVIRLCTRPFSDLNNMHQELIKRFNALVKPEDTVIHCGDFCFGSGGRAREILSQLNGRHILVMGNHDKGMISMMNAGFILVVSELALRIGNKKVLVKHYPYRPAWIRRKWNRLFKPYELKHLERRPPNNGGWLIHGHTHRKEKLINKMINVGVDSCNYRPVSFSEIESIIYQYENNHLSFYQKIAKVFRKYTDKEYVTNKEVYDNKNDL